MVNLYFMIGCIVIIVKALYFSLITKVFKNEIILSKTGIRIVLIQFVLDFILWPVTTIDMIYRLYKVFIKKEDPFDNQDEIMDEIYEKS